ncbi:MAG: ABC transporter substrate-binding protein [Phascolarctobacterium sp.]|nr:ABC transporter substrate-binding protein [Phascolarctobacterium sp.]
MKFSKKGLAAAAMLGLMAFAAGCGGGDAKPADKKAADANQSLKGKKLVMYVSFHEDTAKGLSELFKKKTGAEVSFIRLPTGEAIARMTAEKAAPKADVWLGGTSDGHAKMKADGITMPYASKNANMIPAEYRDKDSYWHGLYLETLAIGYNEGRFKKEFEPKGIKAPTKLEDLLNPAFKGEIITPDPRKSGTGFTFLSSIEQSMGDKAWDFLGKFKANVAQFTPSGYTPAQKCAAGEYLITVNFVADQTLASNKGQKIISTIYPNAGWSVVPVSKMNNKANDEVAKAFIDFCLTKEAGEIISKSTNAIACNPEVAAPAGQKPLKELNLFKAYDFAKAASVKKELTDKFFK